MKLLVLAHPMKVKDFVAEDGIVVENLVELTKAKEENLIVVVLFEAPVLNHGA